MLPTPDGVAVSTLPLPMLDRLMESCGRRSVFSSRGILSSWRLLVTASRVMAPVSYMVKRVRDFFSAARAGGAESLSCP